jgi:hypothetical protein
MVAENGKIRMKQFGVGLALGAALLALAPACSGASRGGEGLAGTPHDFTSTGTGDVRAVPGIGLCTFCHTPERTGSRMMWNHTPSANTFRWDIASTSAGTPLPMISGPTYKGASARCLSCHDGSVAIGDISVFEGQPASGQAALSSARMTDFSARYQVGVGGDLGGNHPVGVPYPMGRMPNHYNGVTNGQYRGVFAANEWQPNPTLSSGTSIRLYQDDGAGNISALVPGATTFSAGIECSSCHDPHNKASVDAMFLRGKLSGRNQADGYLCQQCHNL